MENLTLNVPSMYGDHHVVAVRNLLLALPGVMDVYASSAFQSVEILYDPVQATPDFLRMTLQQSGYTEEWKLPTETAVPATQRASSLQPGQPAFFRHTAAYAQTGQTVSFAQKIPYAGRPLWPCPGMGPLKSTPGEG